MGPTVWKEAERMEKKSFVSLIWLYNNGVFREVQRGQLTRGRMRFYWKGRQVGRDEWRICL